MQIVTLYEREEAKEQFLTPELQRLYGGDLSFPEPHGSRPYVIGNFVETIDGVVSFRIPGRSGGGEISGGSDEDRFVMWDFCAAFLTLCSSVPAHFTRIQGTCAFPHSSTLKLRTFTRRFAGNSASHHCRSMSSLPQAAR
jgi:hypothetical protein